MQDLKDRSVSFAYEQYSLKYTVEHTYTPDFLLPNGIIVEAKDGEGGYAHVGKSSYYRGSLDSAARGKMLRIKKLYPNLDIRFVFRTDQTLHSLGKKCSAWCKEHGFKYHIGNSIPDSWLKEEPKNTEGLLLKKRKEK